MLKYLSSQGPECGCLSREGSDDFPTLPTPCSPPPPFPPPLIVFKWCLSPGWPVGEVSVLCVGPVPHASYVFWEGKEPHLHDPAQRWCGDAAAPGFILQKLPFCGQVSPQSSVLPGNSGATAWRHLQHQDPTLGNFSEAGTRSGS